MYNVFPAVAHSTAVLSPNCYHLCTSWWFLQIQPRLSSCLPCLCLSYFHTSYLSYHYFFLTFHFPVAAKSLQSCPTLCNPRNRSPPGSPVPGILQARTLEWVAISFSNEWKWKVKGKSLSRVQLLATPWTTAYQAPPSMGFSRQEYWSGVPFQPISFPVLLTNINVVNGTSTFIVRKEKKIEEYLQLFPSCVI